MASSKQEINPLVKKYEEVLNLYAERLAIMQKIQSMDKEYRDKEQQLKNIPRELKLLKCAMEDTFQSELEPCDKKLLAALGSADVKKEEVKKAVEAVIVPPPATPLLTTNDGAL